MIEKSFLKDLIDHPNLISDLRFEEISKILESVKKIFENEYLLLEFNQKDSDEDIFVIGDIHGNLETLLEIFELIGLHHTDLVIFLGDIVDRGPKQLECLLFIFILKILNPHKYYILRGNHESLEINKMYGFYEEFINKFKDPHKFEKIEKVYNLIPICALVNDTILCLHGGIPQNVEFLMNIRGVKTKDFSPLLEDSSQDLTQIIWNDPKEGLQGFTDSFRGPGIKFFGEDVFDIFMSRYNLKFLIRAHECFSEGFRWFFHHHLLSIFSSANYQGGFLPNPASYAVISKNEIIPKIVNLKE